MTVTDSDSEYGPSRVRVCWAQAPADRTVAGRPSQSPPTRRRRQAGLHASLRPRRAGGRGRSKFSRGWPLWPPCCDRAQLADRLPGWHARAAGALAGARRATGTGAGRRRAGKGAPSCKREGGRRQAREGGRGKRARNQLTFILFCWLALQWVGLNSTGHGLAGNSFTGHRDVYFIYNITLSYL